MRVLKIVVAFILTLFLVFMMSMASRVDTILFRAPLILINFLLIGLSFEYWFNGGKELLGFSKSKQNQTDVIEPSVIQEMESSLDDETEELERLIKQKERELEKKKELKAKQDQFQDQLHRKELLEEKKRRLEQLQREIDDETDFLDNPIV